MNQYRMGVAPGQAFFPTIDIPDMIAAAIYPPSDDTTKPGNASLREFTADAHMLELDRQIRAGKLKALSMTTKAPVLGDGKLHWLETEISRHDLCALAASLSIDVMDDSPATAPRRALAAKHDAPRQDAFALDLDAILTDMQQRSEKIVLSVVWDRLQKLPHIDHRENQLFWERDNGEHEALTKRALRQRIDRWKRAHPIA